MNNSAKQGNSPQISTPTAATDYQDVTDDAHVLEIKHKTNNVNIDDNDDDDDEDDISVASDSNAQLKLDIDLEQVVTAGSTKESTAAAAAATATATAENQKRRSSVASAGSQGKRRRRGSTTARALLSANSLMELSSLVTKLQDDFEDSQRMLARIDNHLERTAADDLDQVLGDELMVEFRQILRYQEQIVAERKRLHRIAQERKGLEQEAIAYLPWLEKVLQQNQDDIGFCNRLEKDLEAFLPVHAELKKA